MIKYLIHEAKYYNVGTIAYKCKYCGIEMIWDNKLRNHIAKFSVSCLTEDELIIKNIIE